MRFLIPVAMLMLVAGCSQESTNQTAPPKPAIQFERAAANQVEHGQRIARVLGCFGCHGQDLTGEDWSEPGFGTLWTANLTTSAPRYSDEQLAGVIRGGERPDGSELWEMPSHLFTKVTADDMTALIAFVRSKPPNGADRPSPVFEDGARREMAAGTFKSSRTEVSEQGDQWPPEAGEQHALGRYIVRATCAECHGMNLEGGQPTPEATPRPNLRVIISAYDAPAFERLLRTGKALGDRELKMMSGVARGRYSHLTTAELSAVHGYLTAIQ
jgi:mono/diheme cytochrome c family protein